MKKRPVMRLAAHLAASALLLASLTFAGGAAFAAPNVQQIEAAMSQGDWARADAGLQQVLQAHPGSARAHYLYAQVLEREGQSAQALAQIEQAKSLDPQLHFASSARFAQIEARIRAHAARANNATSTSTATRADTTAQAAQLTTQSTRPATSPAAPPAAPKKHTAVWIGLAVVLLVAVVFVLRRLSRRAQSNDAGRADADWRDQLKRATDLLNAVRSLKLDVRLSTAPGHDVLEKEVDGLEAQLRGLIDTLSNSRAAQPPWQLETFTRQYESLKARAEGRPDPNAGTGAAGAESAYAREADANFGAPPQMPYPQQQPVVVQQGGGMGGLLTGVLLGEALGGSRERVVERDVFVDNDHRQGGDGSFDFGQGSNDWDDSGSGGGLDFGSNDDSGGWDNS